jgi:8-amino-3,8-dideoxy-alpha-D-manno-octulosonate transaminase
VITQAFNFVATVEAIIECGAKPVIVNVDETYNMCPSELKKAINLKTKAIIPVHMLGVSANMKEIIKIAKNKKFRF